MFFERKCYEQSFRSQNSTKVGLLNPAGIYLLKVGFFIINFEHISHLVSIVNFEHVPAVWK